MYKHNRKITILLITLFAGINLFAAVVERKDDIVNDSVSSSIPYSFHYENFQNSVIKSFDKLDLSAHGDKRLFVGYGLSDKTDKNCYFVDNAANKNILRDFEEPIVVSGKSYAISRSTMSYSNCKNLAVTFAGYVYNPMSASEDSEIKKYFKNKDFWIGITRVDCGSPWKNQYGIEQEYNKVKNLGCDPNRLAIVSAINAYTWKLEEKNKTHYCLLQIDSKDYLRPIKVCAPWWQIEQTYDISCKKNKTNLYPFFNMDLPKEVSVCVDAGDANNSAIIDYEKEYADESKWSKYTCTSYYSKRAGESCKEDMHQEQCKVDECAGDVEKKCRLLETTSSDIKDYELGVMADAGGKLKKTKVKDNIKTYEYLCPPPRPSISNCLEYKTVNVFPTEKCNPGGCNKYFTCLNAHPNDITQCDNLKSGCEKRYGFRMHVKADKTIDYAEIKCNDGRILHNTNINEVNSIKSRCTEYNTIRKTDEKEENCVAEKTAVQYDVNVSLTENDIYADDPTCIRLNNDEEIPQNSFYVDFRSSVYMNTKITKITPLVSSEDMSESNITQVIRSLGNGQYAAITADGNRSLNVKTLSSLEDFFATVNSIVIGSDEKSQWFLTDRQSDINATAPAAKTPVYKYFKEEWWRKRVYMFDSPELKSITRPYSKFAQCIGIPLDIQKSTYGTPYPSYNDGTPKSAPNVIRENYENSKYMENYNYDQDVKKNGLYCKKRNNSHYVNWYGDSSNELKYDDYTCSRLYDKNGNIWPVPVKKRYTKKHVLLKVDGTSKKRTAEVTDKLSIYSTKTACETATGKTCKSVGTPIVVTFKASYLSTTKSETDKYKAESPNLGSDFDWITGVSSGTLVEDYLEHMGIDYNSVEDSSAFESWLDDAFDDYSREGVLHTESNASITVESDRYIPNDYTLKDSAGEKTVDVAYYEYQCPSGYSPTKKGLTSYSKKDPDATTYNNGIFASPNSSTPPKENCVYNNYNSVIYSIKSTLGKVIRYDNTGGYCLRTTPIIEAADKKSHYADYNCSKYFGSNGTWDYRAKIYYLYKSTTFNYFRQKSCSYGNLNVNNISKDGSNAVIFDVQDPNYLTNLKSTDEYVNLGLDIKQDYRRGYSIPAEKKTLAGVNTESSYKVVDKDLLDLDKTFELFRNGKDLRLVSVEKMDKSKCEDYVGDLNQTSYVVKSKIFHEKCIIDFDYFNEKGEPAEKIKENTIAIKSGSFNYEQNGTSSLLAIEGYVDGKFGYKTNHVTEPYKDNLVKINNKTVYPILDIKNDLTVEGKLYYDRKISQVDKSTKSKIVPQPSDTVGHFISFAPPVVSTAFSLGYSSGALMNGLAALGTVDAIAYVVNIFGGRKNYTIINREIELYEKKGDYRYVPNIYGYDIRYEFPDRFRLFQLHRNSGERKRRDGATEATQFGETMKGIITGMGIEKTEYESVLKAEDTSLTVGKPSAKWYDNGTKKKKKYDEFSDELRKDYNTIYYGATNTLTIFLPFKADYEVMAIDKNGNILGKRTVLESQFIETSNNTQPYKQVFFSLDDNFNLADGIKEGNTSDACRFSHVTEWGGGVSGSYYSYGTPKGYNSCSKSDDIYVQEHSANFIAIRPFKKDAKFSIIRLKHPMPYANRVFLTTTGKLINKKYACYADNNCSVN